MLYYIGHLFCHTCIMEALIAGEQQGPDPGKGTPKCPVCRKKVIRPRDSKNISQLIPVELKVKTRGDMAKGKGKATAEE